ncbi:MAG: hypothetical protein SGJ18_11070 [Pseudomonadota bacterium]|nr:hypothetical protein [Pseudomonadota bacterium]
MAIREWVTIYVLVLTLTGCRNYLETFSQVDSDRARLVEANLALNARDFDLALTWIGRMGSEYRNTREVKYIEASAHSGKCGMEAMTFLQTVDAAAGSGFNLFTVLMAAFKGGTLTQMADCRTAENLLRSISSSAEERTDNENIFLALVSLAKIGIILNEGADLNDDGLVNDGFVSPDHCNATTVVDNSEANEIVTGLVNFMESIGVLGSTFGGDEVASVNVICNDPLIDGTTYDFCGVTSAASVTVDHRKAIRSIFGSSVGLGIGICTGDFSACACP